MWQGVLSSLEKPVELYLIRKWLTQVSIFLKTGIYEKFISCSLILKMFFGNVIQNVDSLFSGLDSMLGFWQIIKDQNLIARLHHRSGADFGITSQRVASAANPSLKDALVEVLRDTVWKCFQVGKLKLFFLVSCYLWRLL